MLKDLSEFFQGGKKDNFLFSRAKRERSEASELFKYLSEREFTSLLGGGGLVVGRGTFDRFKSIGFMN
jgi:hypothetical protein